MFVIDGALSQQDVGDLLCELVQLRVIACEERKMSGKRLW